MFKPLLIGRFMESRVMVKVVFGFLSVGLQYSLKTRVQGAIRKRISIFKDAYSFGNCPLNSGFFLLFFDQIQAEFQVKSTGVSEVGISIINWYILSPIIICVQRGTTAGQKKYQSGHLMSRRKKMIMGLKINQLKSKSLLSLLQHEKCNKIYNVFPGKLPCFYMEPLPQTIREGVLYSVNQ